jgi:plastocyanin
LAIALSLIALGTAAGADDVVIRQIDRRFDPAHIEIRRGAVVHFTNAEKIVHHAYVASGGFSFDSGEIPPGGDFAAVFDKTGHFLVRCAIHPQMKLDVVVTEPTP